MRIYLHLFILFVVVPIFLYANTSHAYTIGDAVNAAKANNKGIKAKEQDRNLKQLGKSTALSAFMPRVVAQSQGSWNYYDKSKSKSGNLPDRSNIRMDTVSLEQEVFSFGTSIAKLNAEIHNSKSAAHTYIDDMNTLIIRTIEVYNNVRATRNQYYVSLQREKTSKQIMEQSAIQFQNGVITRSESSEAQAAYAGSIAKKESAIRDLKASEANYVYITGEQAPLEISAIDIDAISISPLIDNVIDKVALENPKTQAAKESWKAAKANKIAAAGELLPTITVKAMLTAFPKKDRSDNVSNYRNGTTYILNLSVPIFDARNFIGIKKSVFQEKYSEYGYYDTKENVSSQAVKFWNSYNASKSNVTARIESVKHYNEAFKGINEQFKYGTKTMTDLLNAQTSLYDAKLELIVAEKQLIEDTFSLKSLLNEINDVDFDKISSNKANIYQKLDDNIFNSSDPEMIKAYYALDNANIVRDKSNVAYDKSMDVDNDIGNKDKNPKDAKKNVALPNTVDVKEATIKEKNAKGTNANEKKTKERNVNDVDKNIINDDNSIESNKQ